MPSSPSPSPSPRPPPRQVRYTDSIMSARCYWKRMKSVVFFVTGLLLLLLSFVDEAAAAVKPSLTDTNSLACYVCFPPYSGDETSRNAANDIRSGYYRLFADQSKIDTCDKFSATGQAFQKACATTDKSKQVVCTSITNGIWVARSCETIFADDVPKCTLKNGVRSCQCDSYLCNESGAASVRPASFAFFAAVAVAAAAIGLAAQLV